MNTIFDKNIIHKIITLSILAGGVFFLSQMSLFFLPQVGVEKSVEKRVEIPYVSLRLGEIFDVKNIPPPAVEDKKEELYELTNIELKALFANESGVGWIVIVDKASQKSEVLKNGDIFKGYVLKEITKVSAFFENNGKRYSVNIIKPKLQELQTSQIMPPKASLNIASEIPTIRAVPQREIAKYRTNFDEIWRNIAIKEVEQNGEITGFKINWIKEDSIFAQLGFLVGDIIKAVNNKELKSYADAFNIYNNIHVHKSLKFTIQRDSEVRELEYEVY